MAVQIQKLFTGMPLPIIPQIRKDWNLERYQQEIYKFHEELLDYIRRLLGQIGGQVFNTYVQEIINETVDTVDEILVTNWRYDATTHKFQIKTKQVKTVDPSGAESAWTDASGTQPTAVSNITDWQYNATTHTFQRKTRTEYVLEAGAESSFGSTTGDQPVLMSTVTTDVNYSTGTHIISQDYRSSVYVLQMGAATTAETIDAAEACV